MSDKNSIDYQMYLDYLDGKQDEPKPEKTVETEQLYREYEEKISTLLPEENEPVQEDVFDVPEEPAKPEPEPVPSEPERPLTRLEEIERKYNLNHDGEEKGVHLMTDEEFEKKYGTRAKHKAYNLSADASRYDVEGNVIGVPASEGGVKTDEYEDVYSYDADNELSMPQADLAKAQEDAERDLESEDDSDSGKRGKGKQGKKGKKKKWWIVLIVIALILGSLGTVAYIKRDSIYHKITSWMLGTDNHVSDVDTEVIKQLEQGDDQNHGDVFYEPSAAESYSMEGWLDSWQKLDGQLMYNDKIVNVLFIGMDDPEGSEYGRSDSMILVSIDTINQKLKLTSIWRDTYGLIEVPEIEGKQRAYDTHEKINGSNYYGGPECVVKTIESMYKCRIDGYVMTTFDSFKDLIDAMGGIRVDVEEKENDFLQREAQKSWHATAGEDVLLNGSEALVYSRIRHLDSDIKRTERQRKVIGAMLDKVSELSTTQMFKMAKDYLAKGYITTNFSENDISKLGPKAVFGKWNDFEMEQLSAPVSLEVDPSNGAYLWGGTYHGAWVWLVDVPKTATDVQKFIYGETFCELNTYRHSVSQFAGG